MKILMLLFKDIHHDARVKREALALAEEGHEVLIACLEEYMDEPSSLHENIEVFRFQISTRRLERRIDFQQNGLLNRQFKIRKIVSPPIKLLKDILANCEFMNLVKSELRKVGFLPDVVHCHDLNTLPIGALLKREFKKKLVYDSHELFNEMVSKSRLEKRIGYAIESFFIKRVDHLITVNKFLVCEFNKRYGTIPSTIIQNIPIHYEFSTDDKESYFRKKYKLSEEQRLLLYQGGLNPERGLENCIEAVQLLQENYSLIFLGGGRNKVSLKELVRNLQLEHRVFFHEQVPSEQLAWYTKQADIGLVMYENTCRNNYLSTPNKIFEYIQAGLPTVASNHPGKAEVINQYQTGVTVEETPQGIRNGILDVEDKYSRIKENCIKARTNLNWQEEKVKLIEMYQKLGDYS